MSKPAGKSFAHPSELVRLECAATTRASPAVAWKIFTDWHKWTEFTDLYGELVWTEGEPWKVGSRLRMEIVRPK